MVDAVFVRFLKVPAWGKPRPRPRGSGRLGRCRAIAIERTMDMFFKRGGKAAKEEAKPAPKKKSGGPLQGSPPPPLSLSPLSISSLETRSRAFLLLSVLADTTLTRPRRQTSPGVSWPGSFCRPASSSPRGFRSWYASLYPSRASRSSSERSPTRTSLLTSFVGFCLPRSASRASEGP